MAGHRLLSHTEIDTAQTCWARHAFAYTGHLTEGRTLRPRRIASVLSEGRAWGSAVAKWHAGSQTLLATIEAADALRTSLDLDEAEMFDRGVVMTVEERTASEERLLDMLAHYIRTSTPLGNLTRLEQRVIVGIPSRTRRRHSTRYRFEAYLDGFSQDEDGRPWLVEFKLRGRLSPVELVQRSRQLRWYAWALREAKGVEPFGVLVDERLNEVPRRPRILQNGNPSHAVNQLIEPGAYREACQDVGLPPSPAALEHFEGLVWQQRIPIIFRPGEIDEAGAELISAAKLIRDLDSGELYPIRHATAMTCRGCRFAPICENPGDELYVESLYEYAEPKRSKSIHTLKEAA